MAATMTRRARVGANTAVALRTQGAKPPARHTADYGALVPGLCSGLRRKVRLVVVVTRDLGGIAGETTESRVAKTVSQCNEDDWPDRARWSPPLLPRGSRDGLRLLQINEEGMTE